MSLGSLPSELILEIYGHTILPSGLGQYYVPTERETVYMAQDALNLSSVNRRFREIIGQEMWKHLKVHVSFATQIHGFWLSLAADSLCTRAHTNTAQFHWRNKNISLNILRNVRLFSSDVNTPVYLFETSTMPKGRLTSQLQLVNPRWMPNLQTLHTEVGFVYSFFSELGLALHEYNRPVKVVLALSDFVSLDKLDDYGLLPFITTFAYVYNVVNKPENPYDRGDMSLISRMNNLEALYLRALGSDNESSELISVALNILKHVTGLPLLKELKIYGIPLKMSTTEMGWIPATVDSLKWDCINLDTLESLSLKSHLFQNIRTLQLGLTPTSKYMKVLTFPFRHVEELCLPWWQLPDDHNQQVLVKLIQQNPALTALHIHGIRPSQLRVILPYLKFLKHLEFSYFADRDDKTPSPVNEVLAYCSFLKTLEIIRPPPHFLSIQNLAQVAVSNLALNCILISPAPPMNEVFSDWLSDAPFDATQFCTQVEKINFCPGKGNTQNLMRTTFALRIGVEEFRSLL